MAKPFASFVTVASCLTMAAALTVVGQVPGANAAEPLRVAQAKDRSADLEFWKSVKDSNQPAELEAYLEAFPDGLFSTLARIRLKRLTGGGAPAAATAPQAPAQQPPKTPPAAATEPAPQPVQAQPSQPAPQAVFETASADPSDEGASGIMRYSADELGWVGIEIRDVRAGNGGQGATTGAQVINVAPHGTAAKAGLTKGDVIVAVDGRPVAGMADFVRQTSRIWPGRTVLMTTLRDGRTEDVVVTIGGWLSDNRAAAAAGQSDAMYTLGIAYLLGRGVTKDAAMARAWFEKAAQAGDRRAQYRMGEFYRTGTGVAKDPIRAAQYFHAAAQQGQEQAQIALARAYQSGSGVNKDFAEAARWLGPAAQNGNALAEAGLGYLYAEGLGVPKDPQRAVALYRRAADKGNTSGINNLANAYWSGEGIGQDRDEALRLWRRAARAGHDQALSNLRKMGEPLVDVAEVQARLVELGYDAGAPDGKPGTRTRNAIKRFQQDRGMEADGEISMALAIALEGKTPERAAPAPATQAPPPPMIQISDAEARSLQDLN